MYSPTTCRISSFSFISSMGDEIITPSSYLLKTAKASAANISPPSRNTRSIAPRFAESMPPNNPAATIPAKKALYPDNSQAARNSSTAEKDPRRASGDINEEEKSTRNPGKNPTQEVVVRNE